MSLKKLLSLAIVISLVISCKKKVEETDNLFKFRDYIAYTTSGLTSIASPIQINLANEVEAWEMNQDIADKIISISPHVEGKLVAANKHNLIFTPNKLLEPALKAL